MKQLSLICFALFLWLSLSVCAVAQEILVHQAHSVEDGDPKLDADGVKNGVVVWKGGAIHIPLRYGLGHPARQETLMIQSGAIVKAAGTFDLDASGRVLRWSPPSGFRDPAITASNGASIQIDGATLTDIRDDTVGGDTNQDGSASSVPASGISEWGLIFSRNNQDFITNSTIRHCSHIFNFGSMRITGNRFLQFGKLGGEGTIALNAVPVISGNTFELVAIANGVLDLRGMSPLVENNTIRGGNGIRIGPWSDCPSCGGTVPVGPTTGQTIISNNLFESPSSSSSSNSYGVQIYTVPADTLYTLTRFRAEIRSNTFRGTNSLGTALELALDAEAVVFSNQVSGYANPMRLTTNNKTETSRLDIQFNRFSLEGVSSSSSVGGVPSQLWSKGTFVKAENNFWGDPSGPLDTSKADGLVNPNGKGLKIQDGIDYAPFTGGSVPPPKDSIHIRVAATPAQPFDPNANVTFNVTADAYELLSAASGQIVALVRDADGIILNQPGATVNITAANRTATLPPISLNVPELTDLLTVEAVIVSASGGESVRSNIERFAVKKPVASFSIGNLTDVTTNLTPDLIRGNRIRCKLALTYTLTGSSNGRFEVELKEQVKGSAKVTRDLTTFTVDAPLATNRTVEQEFDLEVPLRDVLKEPFGEVAVIVTLRNGAGTATGKLARLFSINEDANQIRFGQFLLGTSDGGQVTVSGRDYYQVGDKPAYSAVAYYRIGTKNVTNWQVIVGRDTLLDARGVTQYQYDVTAPTVANAATGPEREILPLIGSSVEIPTDVRKYRAFARLIGPGGITVAVGTLDIPVRAATPLFTRTVATGPSQLAFTPTPVTLNFTSNQRAGTATVEEYGGTPGAAAAALAAEETSRTEAATEANAPHKELVPLKKFYAVYTNLTDGSFAAKLRLSYNPATDFPSFAGLREDDLVIVAVNPLSGGIEALPSTLDKNARTVTADFSKFFVTYALAFNATVENYTTVSAASYQRYEQAAESIVSAFGGNLATATQGAMGLPLPTELAGTRLMVRDSLGVERLAPLLYVSATQVNYQLPLGTASGPALLLLGNSNGALATERLEIVTVSPALFTANQDGAGVPAGFAIRVKPNGEQAREPLSRLDSASGKQVPAPIDLGPEGEAIILELYGTGIRGRSSQAAVMATIGGVAAGIEYADRQPDFVGLDQVNIRVPRSLIGRGEVELVLTVEGKLANVVRINVR